MNAKNPSAENQPSAGQSQGVMAIPDGLRNFIDTHCHDFFCDADGILVVGQKPNLPLKLWFVTQAGAIITYFIAKPLHPYFVVAALASITWWALSEIVYGVCPWRRTLGFIGYNIALFVALNFFNVV